MRRREEWSDWGWREREMGEREEWSDWGICERWRVSWVKREVEYCGWWVEGEKVE